LESKTTLESSGNLLSFPSMKQTFGIVDNGTVRDMTPEEIEYYCSLNEPEEETNYNLPVTDASPNNL